MADVAAPAAAPATPVKKGKAPKVAKAKKPQAKPAHPVTSVMVNKAIGDLKERGGSSLQAIKKYIAANYKVDADKLAPFIRRYLKSAVEQGKLVQTKGKGAAGSFKLEGKAPAGGAVKKSPGRKPKAVKAGRVEKKKAAPKKPAAAKAKKPKKAPASPKKVAKPKSPTKAKKTAKPPTKKPKSPKPKKAAAKPKAARKAPAKK